MHHDLLRGTGALSTQRRAAYSRREFSSKEIDIEIDRCITYELHALLKYPVIVLVCLRPWFKTIDNSSLLHTTSITGMAFDRGAYQVLCAH